MVDRSATHGERWRAKIIEGRTAHLRFGQSPFDSNLRVGHTIPTSAIEIFIEITGHAEFVVGILQAKLQPLRSLLLNGSSMTLPWAGLTLAHAISSIRDDSAVRDHLSGAEWCLELSANS